MLISCGKIEAGKTPDRHVLWQSRCFPQQPETIGFYCGGPMRHHGVCRDGYGVPGGGEPKATPYWKTCRPCPGAWQNDLADTAGRLTPRRPAVLVKNDCLLVTGTSVFNTFDCLRYANLPRRPSCRRRRWGFDAADRKERAELDKRTGR